MYLLHKHWLQMGQALSGARSWFFAVHTVCVFIHVYFQETIFAVVLMLYYKQKGVEMYNSITQLSM